MNIDWSLLLLVVIGVVFVIGLIILLQSARGRTGLANAALRLAEALIAYAIRWLERNLPGGPDVPGVTMLHTESLDLAKAKAAYACLKSVAVREIAPEDAW